MTHNFITLLFSLSVISLTSCGDICDKVACRGRADSVEFRLMRNDTNALFGPDAFISRDSIHAYLAFSPLVATDIGFREMEQAISLFMTEGAPVVLEINNVIQDTFTIITTQFGMDDCCLFYRVDSVFMNEMVICSGSCFSPIDIEL